MELQKLSAAELDILFFKLSDMYTPFLFLPSDKRTVDPDYLDVRCSLERILMEYDRRREVKD